MLGNQELVKHINFIDYEKLQFILYNDKFLLSDIIGLLKNRKVVENIISFNIEKFQLIFHDDKLKSLDIVKITELLEDQDVVKGINSIALEKLELIFNKFSSQDIIKVLKDQDVVKGINSITPEKLKLIFNNGNFSSQDIIKVLKDQDVVKGINSITPEKLKLIFNTFSSQNIIKVLEDQDGVKGINSVTTKELKAITDNVIGKVFVSIFKNFEPSVKSTLRFVIPLLRAGRVIDINLDYLNNKNSVYNDIIEHLYSKPNIELLIKHFYPNLDIMSLVEFSIFEKNITCEEPVSKLYNLSLEQVIENVNPHKRAKYS